MRHRCVAMHDEFAVVFIRVEKLVANPSLVPVQPLFLPSPTSTIIPVTERTALINAFDPNFVSPYIQNLTLSLTRSLRSNLTMDLRYVGTLARKQWNPVFNINVPDFLYNGLLQAFDAARSGGESPLLNQIFNGINLGAGTVGQNGFTGAAAMRAEASSPTRCVRRSGIRSRRTRPRAAARL